MSHLPRRREGTSRRRASRREVAERLLGPGLASAVGKHVSRSGAAVRNRLTTQGRRSVSALRALEDSHRGECCVLIGNGPSLNKTDLGLLRGHFTIGLNRIYLLFPTLGFSTDFHVVVNRHVVEQCRDDLVQVPGRLVTTWPNRALMASRADALYLQKLSGPVFSGDITSGVWEGSTVTFVAMQLAYFLGFSKVVLVGVDHRFFNSGPAHRLVTSSGADRDHFDPNYFGAGFKWQLPDLETSELAYRLAREAFAIDGRVILDATVDGALDVFPKADLRTALGSGNG